MLLPNYSGVGIRVSVRMRDSVGGPVPKYWYVGIRFRFRVRIRVSLGTVLGYKYLSFGVQVLGLWLGFR